MENTKNIKPTKYLNQNLDMFKLSQQEMKVKGAKHTPRAKEDAAVNKALYLARRIKNNPNYEANNTVSEIIKRSELNRKVQAKELIRFSPKHAHNFVFGNNLNVKEAILEELEREDITKTRKKKLRAQLREINRLIELGDSLK